MELTEREIQKIINAAFDSVDVINKLNQILQFTDEELDTKNRNVEHLKVMMSKEWFVEKLTNEQKVEIEKIIN